MTSDRRSSRFDRRKRSPASLDKDRRTNTTPEVHILIETRMPNLIVNLIGPITAENGTPVKDAVLSAKKPEMIKRVLINLKKVGFMDSSGITTLLEIKRELEKANKSLILVNPSQFIKHAFDVLNLNEVFDVRIINYNRKDND